MSQRPSAIRPASHSPRDGKQLPLPPVQRRDDDDNGTRPADVLGSGSDHTLPRIAPTSESTPVKVEPGLGDGDKRFSGTPRGLGVHTMLNPSEGDKESANLTQSPRSILMPEAQSQAPLPQTFSHPPPGQSFEFSGGLLNRRILTPRSPRASLGRVPPPDGQRPGFVPTRPGSTLPPDGVPLPATGQPYSFPPTAPSTTSDRRSSNAGSVHAARAPHSQSSSPSASISSYQQPSQASPRAAYGNQPPVSGPLFPPNSFAGAPQGSPGGHPTSPFGAPLPSTMHPLVGSIAQGQISTSSAGMGGTSGNYQIWTIKNEAGSYQIPVDVQAASKMADEKRARNAGASARFRQRRKEKEREASQSISKLENQVRAMERKARDLEQEKEFYRSERDRFREILYRSPATRELALQAPPSPRLSSSTGYPFPPAAAMSSVPVSSYQSTEDSPERAARRRRTEGPSELPSTPGVGPGPTMATQAPYGATMPTSLPPIRMDATTTGAGRPGAPAPAPGPGPYPFDRYPRNDADRGWMGSGPK